MKRDYERIKGRDLMRKAKLEEKGGVVERMDKKAQADYFKIKSNELEDSINNFLAAGGKIKKY